MKEDYTSSFGDFMFVALYALFCAVVVAVGFTFIYLTVKHHYFAPKRK
jgi:hypothetical protein